jgi:hypothetical protein
MSTERSGDQYSERASKGQAYNLAVLTAIADGKQHDNKYILQQYFRHKAFAQMLQTADEKILIQAIDRPEFVEALAGLHKLLTSVNGHASV